MIEEWRDIPDFENYYQASNLGQIRSVPRRVWVESSRWDGAGYHSNLKGQILKTSSNQAGYKRVNLCAYDLHGKQQKHFSVHRLVWAAFNSPTEKQVHHKDGDHTNNCLDNLEAMSKEAHQQLTNSDSIGGQEWLFAVSGRPSIELHKKVKEYGETEFERGFRAGYEQAKAELTRSV